MAEETPNLALSYVEDIPDELLEELLSIIKESGASFKLEKRPPDGAFAALEWMIPTAIVLFVGQSYFGAFFQEMGKDHYGLLKIGIKKLRKRFIGENAEFRMKMVGTEGKVSKEQIFSMIFSIYVNSKSGQNIKLLFFDDSSDELFQETVDCYFNCLKEHFISEEDDHLSNELKKVKNTNHMALAYFNRNTKKVEVVLPGGNVES